MPTIPDNPQSTFALCTNEGCTARLGCERANRAPVKDQQYESFERYPDGSCEHFVLRAKLAKEAESPYLGKRNKPGYTNKGRRLRKHNLHAPERNPRI